MANSGKTVIVAALDATYQRKGFGNILDLVPLAENVVKLSAVCMLCYQEGHYTKRTSAETAVRSYGVMSLNSSRAKFADVTGLSEEV